ncbi:MAG: 4'-phosphopantetheinyl transferase superfamily protein [Zoogloea sp.]|nr:4'-phosphopantetheinyl transferase superfamily protein [Zoogloea sp.]
MKNLADPMPAEEGEEMPLIARVYEVQSAEELLAGNASEEPAAAGQEAAATGADDAGKAAPAGVSDTDADTEAPCEEGGLPFIGRVTYYVPDESIVVERTLSLAEDAYLADHAFVHAPGVKPASACMPVMPMTMSLEVMAEVAACLAPGLGLTGFEDAKATRWIELPDSGRLTLRITAERRDADAEQQTCRIAVAIHTEHHDMPAITASVLFGHHYRADIEPAFTEFGHPARLDLTAEDIYRERYMFHGPSFQCLSGNIVIADRGAAAELKVKSPEGLFRSVRRPQLLIDPALLDGVGQFIGVWAMQHERYVFPIGFRKLELYRPTPPAGTHVPMRIEIVRDEVKTLYADVEIQDGSGAVWMRIKEWGNWKFRWERRLVDFRRQPTRYLLSRKLELPSLPESAVCCMVSTGDIAGFDAKLLARHYLDEGEMAAFAAKEGVKPRQQQWLLGRVAAKDAIRARSAGAADGAEMLHPAAFSIANDEHGQPAVAGLAARGASARISISHSEDRAIALAHDEPVGVDVERIRPRDPGVLESFSTAAERNLLNALAGGDSPELMAEWMTRLWCAKEAAGKLLGTGVNGAPQRFEAAAFGSDGAIRILARGADQLIHVHTLRDGDFIIAYAVAGSGDSEGS